MSLIRNPVADFLTAVSSGIVVSTHLMASVTPIPPLQLIPMTGPDISYSANDVPVLVENSFSLQAYESRRVFGRVEITSNVASNVYVSARIGCTGPNGFSSKVGTVQTNHEGNDTPVGVNYPSRGHLVLYPELLLRVGADPGLYTCQLSVSNGDAPAILTAVARDYDGSSATWLRTSAADDEGAYWWQNNCNDQALPCIYLGGGGGSQAMQSYLFDRDLWVAASDAAFVDASAILELDDCYSGTKSCFSKNWGGSSQAVVSSHLELIQLDSNGQACRTTYSPDITSTVGNDAHYDPVYHTLLAVPVYPACGLNHVFQLRLFAKYVSGNPVRINGSSEFSHTYAIASTSYKGTEPPIPNVVGTIIRSLDLVPNVVALVCESPSRLGTIAPPVETVSCTAMPGNLMVPGRL